MCGCWQEEELLTNLDNERRSNGSVAGGVAVTRCHSRQVKGRGMGGERIVYVMAGK